MDGLAAAQHGRQVDPAHGPVERHHETVLLHADGRPGPRSRSPAAGRGGTRPRRHGRSAARRRGPAPGRAAPAPSAPSGRPARARSTSTRRHRPPSRPSAASACSAASIASFGQPSALRGKRFTTTPSTATPSRANTASAVTVRSTDAVVGWVTRRSEVAGCSSAWRIRTISRRAVDDRVEDGRLARRPRRPPHRQPRGEGGVEQALEDRRQLDQLAGAAVVAAVDDDDVDVALGDGAAGRGPAWTGGRSPASDDQASATTGSAPSSANSRPTLLPTSATTPGSGATAPEASTTSTVRPSRPRRGGGRLRDRRRAGSADPAKQDQTAATRHASSAPSGRYRR